MTVGQHRLADVCAEVRHALERGAPWDACDAFRDAMARYPDDAELWFYGALAHARAGSASMARALVDRAAACPQASPAVRSEILSLRGRLWKDAFRVVAPGPEADTLARRARDEYLAAYAIARAPFPGINAATLSLLLGEHERARTLAREVEAGLASRTPFAGWDLLTAAEAALVRGDAGLARDRYAAAWGEARNDAGRIASARRQLALLARVLPAANEMVDVLRAPDVVAFTGHMIDAPTRSVERFPSSLEHAVARALRERVAAWHAPVVFASAACGADLLMLEAALDAGAEVNVVLPFARDDFVRTSVAQGGEGWVSRFDSALARASRVLLATEEAHLGDDVLYEYGALMVEGLATLRAEQLATRPRLLAVLDPSADALRGGTRHAVDRWRLRSDPCEIVDLATLRGPGSDDAGVSPSVGQGREPATAPRARRELRAMLFADVAGYSRLDDARVPEFQRRFWGIAAEELHASGTNVLLANTWGDALFVVFDGPLDAAGFALRLRDRMQSVDWSAAGLGDTTSIRIALHAAPVYSGHDPVLRRENFFGSGVTRAARIEPVTPPGLVYASEAFAAALAAAGARWSLEYVGTLDLAKRYGTSRLYRLEAA